jgi:hypothetical protein
MLDFISRAIRKRRVGRGMEADFSALGTCLAWDGLSSLAPSPSLRLQPQLYKPADGFGAAG